MESDEVNRRKEIDKVVEKLFRLPISLMTTGEALSCVKQNL